jgi:hypothetical protein
MPPHDYPRYDVCLKLVGIVAEDKAAAAESSTMDHGFLLPAAPETSPSLSSPASKWRRTTIARRHGRKFDDGS